MPDEVSIAYCELNKALLQQISCCQKNTGARSQSIILNFIKEYSEANPCFSYCLNCPTPLPLNMSFNSLFWLECKMEMLILSVLSGNDVLDPSSIPCQEWCFEDTEI